MCSQLLKISNVTILGINKHEVVIRGYVDSDYCCFHDFHDLDGRHVFLKANQWNSQPAQHDLSMVQHRSTTSSPWFTEKLQLVCFSHINHCLIQKSKFTKPWLLCRNMNWTVEYYTITPRDRNKAASASAIRLPTANFKPSPSTLCFYWSKGFRYHICRINVTLHACGSSHGTLHKLVSPILVDWTCSGNGSRCSFNDVFKTTKWT